MNYLNMLEDEMKASEEFTKENFGLQVGDGFPELVRETTKSDKVAMKLILGLMMGSLSGKEFAESLKPKIDGAKPDWGAAIVKNFTAFDTPFSFLYWGIQIGRKMERESATALKALDEGN
jgi:hypothetical protein